MKGQFTCWQHKICLFISTMILRSCLRRLPHLSRPSIRTAISASERPERFYWNVDVSLTTELPPIDRRLIQQPPNSLSTTKESSARQVDTWYTVTLDGRPVKTPSGKIAAVPSIHWAYGIAAEWNAVHTGGIQPSNMPLMTTACTALDRTIQMEECMRYLQTDTLCYWADATEDRILYQRQQAAWKEIHKFMNEEFIDTKSMSPFAQAFGTVDAIRSLKRGLPHDAALFSACEQWLRSLDPWHATLVQAAIRETKSFMAGVALVSGRCTAEMARTAARVEEEVQIAQWGMVEGQHDYDRLNSSIGLHAVSFATQCLQHDVVQQ